MGKGRKVSKKSSKIFMTRFGRVVGSILLTGGVIVRAAPKPACRGDEVVLAERDEFEDGISELLLRVAPPILVSSALTEDGGGEDDRGSGMVYQVGRRRGRKGIERRTWIVWVNGGDRSLKGI